MLTKKEIGLLKKSWAIVRKIDPSIIGDVFYSKLFYDNPELRKMFPKNMEAQYKKIIDMLSMIVARIENFNEIKRDIVDMARRHEGYGVKPHHYNLVGKALLWTLQKGLGNEWNEEMRSAWINCYAVLSGTMINAVSK